MLLFLLLITKVLFKSLLKVITVGTLGFGSGGES